MTRPSQTKPPVVVVISPDWTLRAMVRAELREVQVEALGMQSVDDLEEALARGVTPSVIVLDGAELVDAGAREVIGNLARDFAVLVVDSRIMPAADLPGAEVLRRPVRIQDIVARVLAQLGRNSDR